MDKNQQLEKKITEKYEKAKTLAHADLKIILLGDSAVGKSK